MKCPPVIWESEHLLEFLTVSYYKMNEVCDSFVIVSSTDANKPFLDFKVKNGKKNYIFNTGDPKIRLVFKIASNLAAKVYW